MRLLFIALCCAAPLAAADDLQPLFDAFAKERTQAMGSTEAADALAARAEKARKAENAAAAARLIRDARWALPLPPKGLPKGSISFGTGGIRHGDRVNSVRYSPDGKLLLTASNDRSVKIWDVATGREVQSFRGPWDGVEIETIRTADAVWLPEGKIASVSMSGQQILIWDAKTGNILQKLKPKWPELQNTSEKTKPIPMIVKSLAVTADGKLVSGSDDKIVRLWDPMTGNVLFESASVGRIEAVAAQRKGKFVACVDLEGFLSVFDPTGDKPEPFLKAQMTDGGSASAYALAFSADDAKILLGGADSIPRVIAGPTQGQSAPPNLAAAALKLPAHTSEVRAAAILPDGRHFATGSRDKTLQIANELGELVRKATLPNEIIAIDARPDGQQIAVGCKDGSVSLFDFQSEDMHTGSKDAKEPLWAVAVNPSGTRIAAAGADHAIRIYSADGKLKSTLDGTKASVTCLAFLDDTKLLSGGGDKLLRLWDAATGKPTGEWKGHSAAVLALAATPDGKAVVSGAADRTVIGWNNDGKQLWTWTARSVITALAVSNDSKTVYVGTAEGGLTRLSAIDGKVTPIAFVNAHISGVAAIALEPGSGRFATAGGDGVPKLWTLAPDGKLTTVTRFAASMPAAPNAPVAHSAAAFSPDGRRLAVAGADRIIRLYDPASGVEVRFLRGCTDWITSLAFLPDGDRLAAVSADQSVRIFDVTRFDPVTANGHESNVRAIAVSGDGKWIASVGDDKTIRLWDRATGKPAGKIPAAMDKFFCATFAGPNLLTGGQGGKLGLWNIADKKELASAGLGDLFGIIPAADGKRAALFYRNGDTTNYGIFNLADLNKPEAIITERGREVFCAGFSADFKQVAAGDDTGRIYHWQIDGVNRWPKLLRFEPSRVIDIGFSADGKTLAAVHKTGVVYLADAATRKETAKIDLRGKDGISVPVNALVVSPTGGRFAVIGEGPEIMLCDFQGKLLKRITLPVAANLATFSPDGETLFTANVDGSLYGIKLD